MPKEDSMRRLLVAVRWALLLGLCASLTAQDKKDAEPSQGRLEVVKDLVKGSIHHRPRGNEVEWERLTGKAQVINSGLLQFSDGTPIELSPAPELNEKAAQEATAFLRKLVNDRPVTSFGYQGDTNLQHAMIIHGWGIANHSSLHPAEIIARENKRGFWRDEGVAPGKSVEEKPKVTKDRVKGASRHDNGKREWQRIAGRVRVIVAHTLEFADGTRILLTSWLRTWTRWA
jgi:hypothetical protein